MADRIIVVDDDEALMNMVVFALQHYGYDVTGTSDSNKALEMLRKQGPYSVLLTDLMMPGITGHELLRIARQEDPMLEVVVITAAGTLESAIKALREDGAYDYILKPLDSMRQLSIVIERAAAHRHLLVERDALQTQIREEAEWLQALIANTSDAILAANATGVLTIANPAAVSLLGLEDVIGSPALGCLPVSLASVVADWQALDSRNPAVVEIPWVDGSTQMVNLTPIKNEGGKSMGWVIVMRNISHLKDVDEYKSLVLKEAVQKIQIPLVQAVNTLAELNQLAGRDERVGKVVYRLSNLWVAIKDWGNELTALVENQDDQDVRIVDINLVPMLVEIQHKLKDTLTASGLKLMSGTLPNLPVAKADPHLLNTLMEGLIKRAAMRSAAGGEISVNARVHQNKVWIDVTDAGPAISQEELPHIFEKSYIDLKSELASTGIQLATAKKIIDQMGGQVWVSGSGPLGSTISICLPAVTRSS
jgi:CheY-like chemotaxis protein